MNNVLNITISIFLLISTFGARNNTSLEQIAFDYFANNLLLDDYPDVHQVVFESIVQDHKSKFTYGICFENYTNLRELSNTEIDSLTSFRHEYLALALAKLNTSNLLHQSLFTTRKTKSKNKHAIFLEINRANIINLDFSFVEIISFDKTGRTHYYFEIDMVEKSVQRWCKKRVVY